MELPFELRDWTYLPASEQEARFEQLLRADKQRGIDLRRAPLVRLTAIRMANERLRFLWSHHHLLLDGWSLGLLIVEVFSLYEALRAGRTLQLAPQVPYRDYIAWLSRRDASADEAWWRSYLEGFSAPTSLPADTHAAPGQGQPPTLELDLSAEATAALQAFARQHQLTVNTLTLAAWAFVLSRYSGEQDVVFGSTVAGRPPELPGSDTLVGIFINTLPTRVRLPSGSSALLPWLQALQTQQSEQRQYEHSPLVQVQSSSQVPRGVPLFDSLLVFENYPLDTTMAGSASSLQVRDLQGLEHTNYPLTLSVIPGNALRLRAVYHAPRFEHASMQRLLEHWRNALHALPTASRVGDIALLSEAERQQVLVEWNQERTDYPREKCVHTLFEEQVEHTPDAVAVDFDGVRLTYRELNRRANQLAHRLLKLGVEPGARVGLCVERSAHMVVGMVATLKAGGAYVPLDPSYPKERLAFMVEDSSLTVLLTQESLAGSLPESAARVVCLDAAGEGLDAEPESNPSSGAQATHPIYVIYTSGSTGRPKGVCVPHRGVVRLVRNTNFIHLTPEDRIAQASNASFDAATFEVWGALLNGATLVGMSRDVVLSPQSYTAFLRDQAISVLFVTTALFNQLVAESADTFRTLRQVHFGGDAADARAVRAALTGRPPQKLVNAYGPTESTTFATWHLVQEVAEGAVTVPIGRPLANTELYVLDGWMQPVPVGAAGELYIGGDGLALGYLGRPELTAEKFVPHPFSTEEGARLYRTGDVVRYRADGSVEFIGRADSQVKVRGFRIELGEVESVLGGHPAVRECVVVVRDDGAGGKRLVAYVVPTSPSVPTSEELRTWLKQQMPEYMVPSAFMVLEKLPLTPNGKVDRKALPAPEATVSQAGYVAPRTPTEEQLATIWAEILSVPRVGAEDDFFELGGHSLLATRVLSRLRSAFQVELPVRALFDASTLSALAAKLDEARASQNQSALQVPVLRPTPRTGDLPLAFAQQRLWFLDQLEPGSPVYNIPAALRLSGQLDTGALQRAFQELVHRHESLRTTFASRDGQPTQLIASSVSVTLEVMELQDVPAAERESRAQHLAHQEAQRPFDLANGPLLRASLLRLASDEHVLMLVMHHIVSDGWSMGVLVREMASLYLAFASGQQPNLPPLPIQYADYAVWQRSWLQGQVLDSQLGYWKQQLSGASSVLELPTDKPRPPVQTFRGDSVSVTLPKALSDSIKALSSRLGITPFMTLLAGFQVLLHRYSGQSDLSVGSPIAGRRGTELEGLIGFFINTLVLRSQLSADTSFHELLLQVRDTTLGAYEHQDIPFEKLVEELSPQRDLSRSPFFQVMFVLQNAPVEALNLPGLTLRPLAQSISTAKFDWTLSLADSPAGFTGILEYNTDLFERDTAARAVEHLRLLLDAAVAHPEQKLSALPLLSEAERQQVLVEWNDTRVDYPREASIHSLFEAQAARTPDTVAVQFEDSHLTYRQLDARANQLAHHLRDLGLTPGTPVAMCVERSLNMVISTLAILKAGCAYVPLDPSYPRERLEFMLQDVRAPLLLTQRHLAERLPSGHARLVLLDSDAHLVSQQSEASPGVTVSSDALAYVMYTSGSTGLPKGVCIPHRGVVRLVMGSRFADFGPGEVMLQLAPISFDAATFELWGSLLHGGKLVVFSPHTPSFEELGAALLTHGITTLWLTAALFDQMASTQLGALSRVRQVLAGGDVLSPERVKARLTQGGLLINGYGPTESTTFATTHALTSVEQVGHSVSIGRPISNTQVYVLDERQQPVPPGIPGELYIGGDGLGWGYLNRPELTAEKFVPNPLALVPGERLYRTGDKVRWLANGTLEFLGRLDSQVKLRGFRIELGEIESVLDKHPGVRQSVVVAREDRPGDKRLVAYVVASTEQVPATSELRSFLKERLPEYMVPSAFVALEQMPITANGKVDRKALPVPEATVSEAAYVAPRTPTEEQLAAIWAEVLSVPRVGAEDHFFELGGHSLLATQVVSRLRSAFQVELSLRALFEAPTLSALAAKLDEVRASQGQSALQAPALRPALSTGDIPLSFAQQRLWFLDQLEPGSSVYNIPYALRLSGQLDTGALQRAFQELVHRHESLRTTFASRDGQPIQLIAPSLPIPLDVLDLSNEPATERESRAQHLAQQEAQRPFDLANGPLLRASLLRLASDEHVLMLVMHHIVSDGWSMGVLVREMASLYLAFASGQQPNLPPLPIQYADYAVWQRSWLQGEVLDSQLGYWKQQLSGASSALELPTDKPRPPVQMFRGGNVPVTLPKALSDSIKALSSRLGITPFMTLLAGFQVLLHRYSGQGDISVGSPIAGRRGTELEGLIGFFVNTLVLRSQLSADTSFHELLLQVRDTTLGAYEHQDIPFEKLVEEISPQRTRGRSPLFQVMFALQNAPMGALRLPDLTLRPVELEGRTSKFDWTLSLVDSPEGFTGILEYNTDLFERDTAARAMEHLRLLLDAAVAQPEQKLSALPLISATERHQLLVEWNQTRTDYPREKCVHTLFEEQVERRPDAVAVDFDGVRLTYRELNQRANQLAHRLIKLGVEPGARVGLCVERSADMVVGMVATIKAGGAYVPLDPSYPKERLSFMVEDASLTVLLTQQSLSDSLPQSGARVLCLDAAGEGLDSEPESNPSSGAQATHPIYVIYTSGSTGRPKGVLVLHRGVVRLVRNTNYIHLTAEDRVAQTSNASFDAATFEVWGALLNGATLVGMSRDVVLSPQRCAAFLLEQAISVLFVTTALFNQLVAESADTFRTLRQVHFGGEAADVRAVRAALAGRPPQKLVNAYGPTESTTYATWHLVQEVAEGAVTVPIGRPLANTELYVLDGRMQPVPVGVAGELYIGGDGLALGYLGRPELTAEKFVPHPFSTEEGARLYRTGDVVRYRADGSVEFIGRADSQVKVRGFRIELGEVESVLGGHPDVRECVVVVRDDGAGGKRLVAYVVPVSPTTPTSPLPSGEGRGEGAEHPGLKPEELRTWLKQRMPEYMVPSAFMVLEKLPLTPNGKVDRKALPAPEAPVSQAAYVAPRTPTEEQLAAIWAEVLSVPRVGAEDDFFELGGHSLLATQVVSRLRSAFQVELPVRALFEASTLSALATKLDEVRANQGQSALQAPTLRPAPRTGDIPLSFAQQRLWFLDQLEPGSSAYSIPYALRLSGQLDTEALRRAFQELVHRHESLRTTFTSRDGQPVQRIVPELSLPIEVLDLSNLPASEQEGQTRQLAGQEALRPFDLANGPLLRASLLRLASDEHVLMLVMHHIVSDGWSMGVLVREMASLYPAFASGQHPNLPPLPIQYADYAVWQRSWLQGQVLDSQLGYWKQQLSGASSALELPTDKPRPPVQTFRGDSMSVTLPKALSESIKSLSLRLGTTPFMTLLAGFQVLLHRYSGQSDLSVGSPIAGRRGTEVEGLIGFFVNTLVLRSRISQEATFHDVLRQVRDTTLGAYEHQDIPFEKLVEELSPQRTLGRAPLFQVMFVLQNAPMGALRLPDLTLRPVELEIATSKFDLTLTMIEGPGGLGGAVLYNTDLFEAGTVARMMRHYQTVLEALTTRPDTAILDLPLLTAEERQQVLVEWNDTRADYPREATLHSLVQAQAHRIPDAPALVSESGTLTYRQLTEAATRLALHLRSLGAGPDTRVAISFERSPELLVSILGTLEAGAAWVPLDPEYPAERLAFMLEDSGAQLLLTRSALLEALPATHQARAVCLDSLETLESLPAPAPGTSLPQTSADSPAYVIYTSGSTGRPKGVQVAHRAAVNHLSWRQREFPMGAQDAFLQKASFSFDISVWEMFAPLLAGARLVLARPGGQRDPEYLVQAVVRHAITHLHFGPAPLTAFLQTPGVEQCQSLRFVFCGGEPLTAELHSRFVSTLRARLVHQYGPTETCIDSTAWVSPAHPVSTLPIGRPVANTQVYVLDERRQPLPPGLPGELHIGGDGLALGYLHRPELTAEKFIPDAFSGVPGARLYRTGDKVRWLADGTLEFLGRIDFQVKVRGFRIELGEVESVLARHPAVGQCLVLAREDKPGDKRLVAYVVASAEQAPATSELRSFLQERLPEYMVPSAFMALEKLPLTPNGKVDRRALPAPEATVSEAGYVAPRTATEEQLAAIWAEVLSVPRVGAEDHFFELGGHSLMATQVVARLRSAFQVELPVRALFEAPTLSALARRLDEAQGQGRTARPVPALRPGSRPKSIPLSFAQQRLWFLDQLEPGSPVYNMPVAVRFQGALDVLALERAFSALIERHEVLRTTFQLEGEEPIQVISPTVAVPLTVVDLGALPEDQREPELRRLAGEEAVRAFDLVRGPLFRITLLRLNAGDHVLLMTMHHIVSDGWSTGVLIRELAALYQGLTSGRPATLPALPVQYADYATWQRGWLRDEALEAQLAYWRQQLSEAPRALELSTDKPRPAVLAHRGALESTRMPRELGLAVTELARSEGATPFMVLLAAWQLLLARYSGQDDISVGSPIAGRTQAETESLIGFFVNTLVLRTRLDGNPTFRQLLARVRETALGAYAHQDVPFEKLVEELQPERDLSRTPLFQVMFTLQNTPRQELSLPGLTLRSLDATHQIAKFELSLTFSEAPDGLAAHLEYDTDLFSKATASRILEHLRVLLEGIIAGPDQRLSELPLLSGAERHQVLEAWNDTAVPSEQEAFVHQRFEAQAHRTPDAPALVFDSGQLTYAELDARSTQLAHCLRSLCVGPEVRVGVCMERSPEMMVALLAILKAGATYVPLDPSYPSERLAFMLQDCGASLLLTQDALASLLPTGPILVCLDTWWQEPIEPLPALPLVSGVHADSPAYAIYTSGSTGQPKGTLITHRALANHMAWLLSTFGLTSEHRVLLKTPLSFDASVWECWAPLMVGAPLVLAPPEAHRDPAALVECVLRQRVSVLQVVPSMLRFLLDEPALSRATHLRWLFCGGEALASELAPRLAEALPEVRLVNLYGPTEVTIDATFAQATAEASGPSIPIGRPVANTQVYVLDAALQPVPPGVPGELFIAGAQLARGYLGRPHLTAERFLPNPFSATPGERMYRTGDRVRWLANGSLEYLGRIDFQVKLRGQRIELGEIESALSRLPGVRQALVLVREDVPGNQRLVAYLTATEGHTLESEALRSGLQRLLPEYMVPSVFMVLEALPLTPNGKVDRKALPAPEHTLSEAGYIAPRTATEEQLAAIWAEVLSVPRVGAEDDFFELGGHSLLATRVLSRLRSAFQVELPVRALFEAPTLSALARRIDEARASQGRSALQVPALLPAPRTGDIPLAFAQQRLWFLDQLEPGSSVYNIPSALRLSGQLDTEALRRAFEALVLRHESLRTTFASRDGQPIQRIAPELSISLDVQDLSDVPASEREARARDLVQKETSRPFDLANGPLIRTALLRLDAHDHVLLVTVHHIVSDGWSTGVLVREVASLYRAFASGQQPNLPPLPIQYADFALWQRSWLQGEVLDAQLGYWKRQLGDAPTHLELPTDKPRPPMQTFRGDSVPVALPKALSASIKSLSTRLGVTPFMTLLAGFQVLLSRYSRQDDISVGSPIAGRRSTELEGLIGFFINTLVLRSRFSPEASFRELLLQVRDTTLGAYEHQDIPFEKLVEQLKPQRDLSRSPLFQVMFILQNTPSEALNLPGLTLSPVQQSSTTAKFDWTLALTDTPNGFAGGLEYNTDLFERDTVVRAVEHLRILLEAAISNPETRLSTLPLLSEAEQHKLLVEWNDLPLDYPREATLHELFEAQAARTPDAEALIDGTRSLTYAELNARANQLAHSLRALGVTAETPVGICSKRSADLVVGLLGILKAGGLYVPLDPAYPRERLGFIIEDAQLRFLVAQSSVIDSLPEHSAHVLLLDKDSESLSRSSTSNPVRAASSSNLAYLIYTSGSTGRPKGVSIEHRNAVSFLSWARTVFSPELLSGMLASTSIAFDLSVFELFLPLSLGGTVILAGNALELPSLPAAQRVSLVNTVPSAMAELLRSGGLPSSVRVVNLAGEPLATSLVQQLYRQPGLSLVYDLYGPSETTTYSTFTLRHSDKPATIGRPISGTQVYLLDERLQPVPTGVPGEVFISGAGVSRGYLGRPELTAERFLPDPFSTTPGARMYRTGDLAKYRADGNLEYLGRTDFQVKVRGFRIELGEIETVLDKHPGVRQVVVVAREDRPGDKRLVAYLTPSGEQAPTAAELRTHLKQHLPEHMVPSAFVVLEQLPLTPNGKINRNALPAPEASGDSATEHIAPRTPTEELLASIWSEVLSVPRVGAEDNFFELGGHSLLATRVLSRVRTAFQVELPVRALFEAPTLSALALALETAQRTRSDLQAVPRRPSTHEGDLPLAFSQQRLWFLDQLEPGSPVYNIPVALRLSGQLDTEALRQAFQELVRRHESLRTTFASRDGQPIQLIAPSLLVPLEVMELQDVPASEREAVAQRLAHQEAQRPFDLANGPLLRASLLRLAPDDHVLLVTLHHIISDGWSMGVLVREVAAFYAAFASGQQPSLPPLPVQYADFALWQRSRLQGEVLEAQLNHWRQQLSGAPAHLELSTDRPRPPIQTFRGDSLRVALPKALSESIKALSMRLGVTPFMTLLAGFQVLLHRYSGQSDISVGSPIAGRRGTELEGLIGFFINTLVLRSRFSTDMSFRELLLQVRDTTLGAYEHQDIPFEKLVEELQPQRDLSRPPLFQVMFILQNTPSETLNLPGLSLRSMQQSSGTAKFDWTLALSDTPNGFIGGFEYNTDLFEQDTIARASEHLRLLLEAAVAHPDTRLSELPLLSEAEQHKLLVEWNDLPLDYPREATLHELFEAQAARTPDAEALIDGTRSLTYAELNARANQLAHSLRALGVTAETPVGICSRRSADLVVGLLGILKAGGLYVPLDPAYPRERLAFIIEDAQLRFLVAQSEVTDSLPPHSAHVLLLDKDSDVLARASTSNPVRAASSANLAYLIYTSGSTGRPKGVSIEHRNAVSFLSWARTVFSPELLSGMLASTSIAFDLSVFELFLPLSLGGTVILAGNALELPSLPAAQRVSLVNTVPSAMAELLRSGGLPSSVRVVNLAGEPLATSLVQQLYQQPGLSLVYDLYGPSETTTYSTFTLRHSDKPATIGRPISGTQVYLLDERLQPVPTGVPGEVFISGAGVSRGYLGRPELTAERFLPDPFSTTPGARMYRTGDLAKYRADGNLEYLGRTDFQVKVRGFRIELGEIETVLDKHPGVRQVVVVAREDRPGDKRLVAYLTPSGEQAPTAAELRAHLKQHLPEHMVPSAFVVLEQLPLTPNGKINRKALPAPEASGDSTTEYIAPRTPTEELLARIWSEILSVPRVGIRDNFFQLGGHSLLATRVTSRLYQALDRRVSVLTLFQNPTIELLAEALRQQQGTPEAPRALLRLQAGDSQLRPLFLVHAAGGGVMSYTDLVGQLGTARPIYALRDPSLEGVEPMPASVEVMARHYVSQIREVQPQGPYYLGGWSFGGVLAYEMAQQLQAAGEKVELLALFDTHAPGKKTELDELSLLYAFCNLIGLAWQQLPLDSARMLQLSGRERLAYLLEQASTVLGGSFMDLDQAWRLYETYTRHIRAQVSYEPRPYAGPAVLFKALIQPEHTAPDGKLGWSQWVTDDLKILEVPGAHHDMLNDPNAAGLAERLIQLMRALEERNAA
ncbi:non-ribosomal peptide synthase/polyketide synthase [Archangium lansingense]|uniref:non-ribosomal peptide synthase/polyketide synthase n=1 Tax=Archangium lansingense TaxID=2995310 RepID=UPI003B77C5C1